MAAKISAFESKVRKQGLILSIVIHTIVILLMLIAQTHTPTPPPPPIEGVLVNLGLPDVGQGTENTPGPPVPTPAPPKVKPDPTEKTPALPDKKNPPPPSKPNKSEPKPTVTTEDPNAIAIRERQEKDRKAREESDRVARQNEETQRRADDEKRKKEAEAKATKDQIGGLFGGGGKGSGKGNTGKPGNQGDPDGDPNSKVLEGITTGKGSVGGNLGNRNIVSAPPISDNSSLEGTVVVEVCVDQSGSVSSARFMQKGSTTSNGTLVNLAVNNAKKWRFSPGDVDSQCGTVTYRFKVQ